MFIQRAKSIRITSVRISGVLLYCWFKYFVCYIRSVLDSWASNVIMKWTASVQFPTVMSEFIYARL